MRVRVIVRIGELGHPNLLLTREPCLTSMFQSSSDALLCVRNVFISSVFSFTVSSGTSLNCCIIALSFPHRYLCQLAGRLEQDVVPPNHASGFCCHLREFRWWGHPHII